MSVYNAKRVGLVTSTSVDQSTTIQAAIDAAYTAGGGDVYIPMIGSGIYRIDNTINVKPKVGLYLSSGVEIRSYTDINLVHLFPNAVVEAP